MQRDIFRLVQTHDAFADNCIKGDIWYPQGVPLYCVFVFDILTYVYHPSGRWYGRRDGTPRGANACHTEKVYRSTINSLVDAWVDYGDLCELWHDPHTLPEVRRLLAVSA